MFKCLRAISYAASGGVVGVATARAPSVARSSSSSSSLGGYLVFCHLIREADEAHWQFSVASDEAR